MIPFDGGVFDRAIHPLDLAVGGVVIPPFHRSETRAHACMESMGYTTSCCYSLILPILENEGL